MNPAVKTVVATILVFCNLLSPVIMAGSSNFPITGNVFYLKNLDPKSPTTSRSLSRAEKLEMEAASVYEKMQLRIKGLSRQAFNYAYRGYKNLLENGDLDRRNILSICDFSQSSRKKRLYVIDLNSMKLLLHTYVAHGRNSGAEFARFFSNRAESHQSSLGFYVTRKTYYGEYGLALKIDGVEKGINDRAMERNIVVHGSDYVGPYFLRNNPFTGRSYGCPAVPRSQSDALIQTIKNGSCFFIYHPSKKYLAKSRVLNA